MMSVADITPLILTYNEERNIGRTLQRLGWAKDVVVLDSYSSDQTIEIARSFKNVRLIQRRFDNHVAQWNFGLDQVRTTWVLSLDADYILSQELVTELISRAQSLQEDGYYATFRYCIEGKPLRGSLYPRRLVLFRMGAGRYVSDGHTQIIEFSGSVGELKGLIYHDDRKPLSAWLQAQNRYAELEVTKLRNAERKSLRIVDRLRDRRWIAPLLVPFYCLFVKGLILDGQNGLYYTVQRTYAELLLSLRLFEHDLRLKYPPLDQPQFGSPEQRSPREN